LAKYSANIAILGALVELSKAVVQNNRRSSLEIGFLLRNVVPYQSIYTTTTHALFSVIVVLSYLGEAWELRGLVVLRGFRRLRRFGRLWPQLAFAVGMARKGIAK
jgi:hypothetical protein